MDNIVWEAYMQNNFEEYLTQPKSISFEKMQEIHSGILVELKGDKEAEELYEELIKNATRYASFRAEWFLWDTEKKMERDPQRTSCHNSLIIKFNMLARYLKEQGKEAAWRDVLGYEEDDPYNRKAIGDFACYLVFVNSVNAR